MRTLINSLSLTQLAYSDNYTIVHSTRVALLAEVIGDNLKLGPNSILDLRLAGFLHDIGKLALPKEVLYKPGPLSADEEAQVRLHPIIGARVAEVAGVEPQIVAAIAGHHERLDGSGYPQGLQGDDIDLLTRIICVADVYAAMTSERPYRRPLPHTVALAEISKEHLYDQIIVDSLQQVLDTTDLLFLLREINKKIV